MPHLEDFGGQVRASLTVPDGRSTKPLPGMTDPLIVVTLIFRRPSGATEEKTATVLDGKNAIIAWLVPEGFFDEEGGWEWQARVTKEGVLQYSSDVEQFLVYPNL